MEKNLKNFITTVINTVDIFEESDNLERQVIYKSARRL